MSPFDPGWGEPPAYTAPVHAAALLAVDPAGLGGMVVRGWSGPDRDDFLRKLLGLQPAGMTVRRLPLNVADDRLLGGLDLAATLQAGRPVLERGLLAEAAGGALLLAMAERVSAGVAARLAAVLDEGADILTIALDEGVGPDEAPAPALLDRLAFTVTELPAAGAAWPSDLAIGRARRALAAFDDDAVIWERLGVAAALLGVVSLRALLFAGRAARAAAALRGSTMVEDADLAAAVTLVLAPRATRVPTAEELAAPEPEPQQEPPESEIESESQQPADEAAGEAQVEAAAAVLPPQLLAALAAGLTPRRITRGSGRSGAAASKRRGRPAGVRQGKPGGHARLSLIETLRAAAPLQKLRRRQDRLCIMPEDLRIRRFKEQARSVAVFAVDASGSSAMNRLAEAKGAIQLLLAECYVRRDEVALLAFRGQRAEVLLPPTHALARVRRALAALPGGGPTPLAAGIDAARLLAEAERRRGKLPLLVLLTDGGANIGRNGGPGRVAAAADALAAAAACRGLTALVVDTAPRGHPLVVKIAAAMEARYLALPYADAAALSRAAQQEGAVHASRAA